MSDIQLYTIAQVRAFVDAIGRSRTIDRLNRLLDHRAAQAEGKTLKKHINEIGG